MATVERRDGKRGVSWRCLVRKDGVVKSKTFTTKTAAERWGKEVETEIANQVFVDRSAAAKETLGSVLKTYLEKVVPTHKGADTETIRIKALLQDKALCSAKMISLGGKDIADWRDRRLATVSGSTVNRELNLISAAINTASREWGIYVANPVAQIKRPKSSPGRKRRFERDEEVRLMKELDSADRVAGQFGKGGTRNPLVKSVVLFALETAMRRSEILAMKWEEVDFKNRFVHLPVTKNGEVRDVPLSTVAIGVLKALAEQENQGEGLSGTVFKISADALKKSFSRACERAGVQNFHFHDLRHEATSRLAKLFTRALDLQNVTGHKDQRMLSNYYHPHISDLVNLLP